MCVCIYLYIYTDCVCIHTHAHKHMYMHNKIKQKLLVTINNSSCFCKGHVTIASIYNYLLSSSILYSFAFSKHLSSSWFFTRWDNPNLHY